jgi:hypothetical protein
VPKPDQGEIEADTRDLPSRAELIDAIQLIPKAKIDPGDESMRKSRRMPSLQQIARVDAHFRLLHALQIGALVGKGDFSVWSVEDAGARINAPIPTAFWQCDWGWRDGPPDLTAAIVPDYAGAGLIPVVDVATRISIDAPAVSIGLDGLEALIAAMQRSSSRSDETTPKRGVFKPHGGGWLVGVGDRVHELPALAGLAAISTLLHFPGHDVAWDRLQIVAGTVDKQKVDPSIALPLASQMDLTAGREIKATSVRNSGAIKHAREVASAAQRRAADVTPAHRERAADDVEAAERLLRMLENERRTTKTHFVKRREAVYNSMEPALVRLALTGAAFARHFGLLREVDRRAFTVGDRTVSYSPNAPIQWDLTPDDGWATQRR